jgi:hypothetical protein
MMMLRVVEPLTGIDNGSTGKLTCIGAENLSMDAPCKKTEKRDLKLVNRIGTNKN